MNQKQVTLWRKGPKSAQGTIHAYLDGRTFYCGLEKKLEYAQVPQGPAGLSDACHRCFKAIMRDVVFGILKVEVT